MAGCIKVPSCACQVCSKCKARIERRYQRQRSKGPPKRQSRGACECGVCALCVERARVRAYYQKKREAEARGEPMEPSPQQKKANETRARKLAALEDWRERARERRKNPLSERQKEEVRTMIREHFENWFELE